MTNTLQEKGSLDWRKPERDHHIFARFQPFHGVVPAEFWVEYTGALFRNAFEDRPPAHGRGATYESPIPPFNEEYLEWVALLTSVEQSGPTFSMVELGSGMGHWLINGAVSARQKGKDVRLVGVEAEPTHFAFMNQAFRDNTLSVESNRLIQAAVGGEPGERWFTFGNADHWYGQSLVEESFVANVRDRQSQTADGKPEYQFTKVPVVTLQSILHDIPHVDLLDMDIQGAEAEVVEAAIGTINNKVDVAFVATHNVEVETRLRSCFDASGWLNAFDFSCFSGLNETPYGLVNLPDDGMQCWVNPRRPEIVEQMLDNCESEWAKCRHQNFIRNFQAVFAKQQRLEARLRYTEERLAHAEHRRVSAELEKESIRKALTGQIESMQTTFEGVSPRSARLIRSARRIKSFFTGFGRRGPSQSKAG